VALRESGRQQGETYELGAVTGRIKGGGGVKHGAFLLHLTEAVVHRDREAADRLRPAGVERLGADGFVRLVGVAAGVDGINRVGDAIGIPLDERFAGLDAGFWAETGIDAFGEKHQGAITTGRIKR
jgi:hypothetical protein